MNKITIERGGTEGHPADEDGLSLFVGEDLLDQAYTIQCAMARAVEREAADFIATFYRLDYSAGVRGSRSNDAALYSNHIYVPAKGTASFPTRLIEAVAVIRSLLPFKSGTFYLNIAQLYTLSPAAVTTPTSRSMPRMFNNRMPGTPVITNTPTAARKNLFGVHLTSQATRGQFTPASPSKA